MNIEQNINDWLKSAIKTKPDLPKVWLESISNGAKVKRFSYNRGFIMTAEFYTTPPILNPSPLAPIGYLLLSALFILLSPISSFYVIESIVSNLSGGQDVTSEIKTLLQRNSFEA